MPEAVPEAAVDPAEEHAAEEAVTAKRVRIEEDGKDEWADLAKRMRGTTESVKAASASSSSAAAATTPQHRPSKREATDAGGTREKAARRSEDAMDLIAAIEANEEEAAEKMNWSFVRTAGFPARRVAL